MVVINGWTWGESIIAPCCDEWEVQFYCYECGEEAMCGCQGFDPDLEPHTCEE